MTNNTNSTNINTDEITDIPDDNLLYIYTTKIPVIKSMIEALKEIFRDVSIKFTPKVEKIVEGNPLKTRITGGMNITALNSNSNILVRLHLEADKFDYYRCVPENNNYINLGVNMTNLFKLIKFLNNEDILHIIYNKSSQNQLNLQYINQQKKLTSNYYLNLLDIKEDNITIGKQKFDFVITMPSNDFHSLIKNMSIIAEYVDIKFVNYESSYTLSFSCQGEFASQESVFNSTNSADNIVNVLKNEEDSEDNKKQNSIIQGVYELKALSLFSKCSSLCQTIELYIRNDSPLVIKYRIADMGSVHLILSPINKDDDLQNDNDSEEDDI
jgi:proliferating cell nuclear antigen